MALLVLASRGWAASSDGSLITNAVTATFCGSGGETAGFAMSFVVTSTVVVADPAMRVTKTVLPTQISSGGSLTYTITVLNGSQSHTAFSVTANDRLPDNTQYGGPGPVWGGPTGAWSTGHSVDGLTYFPGATTAGQGNPWYLQWILTNLGPGASAWVQYTAKVL